jgi:hypothetical protein
MHISPNISDDGHDTGLAYGIAWAKNLLTPLLLNSYFNNRTLVLLTIDESATYSEPNKVAALLLGDISPDLQGTTDNTFYTHYSLLSTVENNFGLPNLGRYDVGANVFQIVANATGYRNQNVVDTANVHLSHSYPGYLNSQSKLPIPTPNVELVGAGGQGILSTVTDAWVSGTGCNSFSTPYNGSGQVFDSVSPPVLSEVRTGLNASATTTACAPVGQSKSKSDGSSIRKFCIFCEGLWPLVILEALSIIGALV